MRRESIKCEACRGQGYLYEEVWPRCPDGLPSGWVPIICALCDGTGYEPADVTDINGRPTREASNG